MFEKQEAFDFIKNVLGVENAEQRMTTDKRSVLDDILCQIQSYIPFQNVSLMSVPPSERRKPTYAEMKSKFMAGIGGLCCDVNVSTYLLLSAIGFDAVLVHSSVTITVDSPNNHVAIFVNDVERKGDRFIADVAGGVPTFRAISLDFEKESPVYVDSFLEYKFIKHDGKLYRMHRKGDRLAMKGRQEMTKLEFWIDDWRRYYIIEMEGAKSLQDVEKCHNGVYTVPSKSVFHCSHRVIIFTGGKASMVVGNKTLIENDIGELVSTKIEGGDEGIKSAIQKICPQIPQEMLTKSLLHWRQWLASKEATTDD